MEKIRFETSFPLEIGSEDHGKFRLMTSVKRQELYQDLIRENAMQAGFEFRTIENITLDESEESDGYVLLYISADLVN